jgi:hypothetical protein
VSVIISRRCCWCSACRSGAAARNRADNMVETVAKCGWLNVRLNAIS